MASNTQTVVTLCHHQTPFVVLNGSRGEPVRNLSFLRYPGESGPARCLVQRQCHDPHTRAMRAFGARSLAEGIPDALTLTGLAGQPLFSHTVDGGTTRLLSDIEGRPFWGCSAEGTVSTWHYEAPTLPGRLLYVTEQAVGAMHARVRQALTWAGSEATKCNLAGAVAAAWDNAGVTETLSMSLTGVPLKTRQRLLDSQTALPDWPDNTPQRQALLEPDAQALESEVQTNATGEVIAETNALGVTTHSRYDISGTVAQTWLTWQEHGQLRRLGVLDMVEHTADGRLLAKTEGNGVVSHYEYEPQTQRLSHLTVSRPLSHTQGAQVLQDLSYHYDPVGNVIMRHDAAVTPDWHSNQQTAGSCTYTYDSLYRLISARGRERLPDTVRGPLSGLKYDNSGGRGLWCQYTENYKYDDGDNLIQIKHQGLSPWTRGMVVSTTSNRAILKTVPPLASSPDMGFTPGGRQRTLVDGRQLEWYADGQLAGVSPVIRTNGAESDRERYQYASAGVRVRKVRTTRVSGGSQRTTVTYAGGIERRQCYTERKMTLHVAVMDEGNVRLIWDYLRGQVHVRYVLSDILGSVTGETDELGRVTSREEYYPYGGSAGSVEETSDIMVRTRRYSGKERDATGLVYYGYRYYQPGLCRWLSTDPAGTMDGLNLFRMVRNNPITLSDPDGRAPEPAVIRYNNKSRWDTSVIPRGMSNNSMLTPERASQLHNHRGGGASILFAGSGSFQHLTSNSNGAAINGSAFGLLLTHTESGGKAVMHNIDSALGVLKHSVDSTFVRNTNVDIGLYHINNFPGNASSFIRMEGVHVDELNIVIKKNAINHPMLRGSNKQTGASNNAGGVVWTTGGRIRQLNIVMDKGVANFSLEKMTVKRANMFIEGNDNNYRKISRTHQLTAGMNTNKVMEEQLGSSVGASLQGMSIKTPQINMYKKGYHLSLGPIETTLSGSEITCADFKMTKFSHRNSYIKSKMEISGISWSSTLQ